MEKMYTRDIKLKDTNTGLALALVGVLFLLPFGLPLGLFGTGELMVSYREMKIFL